MKHFLAGLFLLTALQLLAVDMIPGEVDCSKGVEMPKVQALVKKTVEALKTNQQKVIQEINQGDKQWKDGDLYVVVVQERRSWRTVTYPHRSAWISVIRPWQSNIPG